MIPVIITFKNYHEKRRETLLVFVCLVFNQSRAAKIRGKYDTEFDTKEILYSNSDALFSLVEGSKTEANNTL
jgi:hypothetical protein